KRPIPKGTRIIEYTGERISHAEADRRYPEDGEHPHVLLFIVDRRTVIDAGVGGNEARFINHSCDPNCEAVIEKGRVFIEAIRDIARGEELTYDYHLTRDDADGPEIERLYPCNCGSQKCRGTMLRPPPRRRRNRQAAAAGSRSRQGSSKTRSAR
ncbi:MAG TPA: SET domain-containing protein-lysine N-methyltransferase, partial [Gemmatimonadaceae bacterium]|nr:SET domain-containing protein-lysine N-methyltransferase [Gemmatimonadaceae bacterium]